MLDINLIRWRSIQKNKQFLQLMICIFNAILLALLLLWQLYLLLVTDIEYQENVVRKNTDLLTNIKVTPQMNRVTVSELRRYQLQYEKIQNIILRHSKTYQLFEILDELLPEQVILSEIQYRGDKLKLKGISHSNNDLSEFLTQLSQLSEFQQPQLKFSLQGSNRNLEHSQIAGIEQNKTNKRFELQVLFLDDNYHTSSKSAEHGINLGLSNRKQNISYKSRGE